MRLVRITFIYSTEEQIAQNKRVKWPTVPRIGEMVELLVNKEVRRFNVIEVVYAYDGHAIVSLKE